MSAEVPRPGGPTADTRLTLVENRCDALEERVTVHGEEIDANAAKLSELSIRAHFRDESMGELKAMSKQTAEAVDDLRQSFAAERVENRNRFDQRDADKYQQVKGYVLAAVVSGVVGFVLAAIGIR